MARRSSAIVATTFIDADARSPMSKRPVPIANASNRDWLIAARTVAMKASEQTVRIVRPA